MTRIALCLAFVALLAGCGGETATVTQTVTNTVTHTLRKRVVRTHTVTRIRTLTVPVTVTETVSADVPAPEPDPSADCSPDYDGACIPDVPYDLNCADVGVTDFYSVGSDPYGFDGDGDGIACES